MRYPILWPDMPIAPPHLPRTRAQYNAIQSLSARSSLQATIIPQHYLLSSASLTPRALAGCKHHRLRNTIIAPPIYSHAMRELPAWESKCVMGLVGKSKFLTAALVGACGPRNSPLCGFFQQLMSLYGITSPCTTGCGIR
jgi:hypothetical protein